MAKNLRAKNSARRALIDQQHAGATPNITSKSTSLDIIRAYNFYNYCYTFDDAKAFTLEYLKFKKVAKGTIRKVQQIKAYNLQNIGWNCHILLNGGSLPEDLHKKVFDKLHTLIENTVLTKEDDPKPPVVISIQDRIDNRAETLIATLEDQIDIFCLEGENEFDVSVWFREQAIKPAIAKRISEYYTPLYSEVFDALKGKDEQLKFGYRRWKKPTLRKYLEFIKGILSASETASIVVKTSRQPRKKKEKPAGVLVSKLKYQTEDTDHGITSIKPTEIIGAQQLWVFNTKTRQLSVYDALGPTGLTVKGTTILGFDEKTSMTKTLRKPEVVLKKVLEGGKLVLRKVMEDIRGKQKVARGRINITTTILRAVKG